VCHVRCNAEHNGEEDGVRTKHASLNAPNIPPIPPIIAPIPPIIAPIIWLTSPTACAMSSPGFAGGKAKGGGIYVESKKSSFRVNELARSAQGVEVMARGRETRRVGGASRKQVTRLISRCATTVVGMLATSHSISCSRQRQSLAPAAADSESKVQWTAMPDASSCARVVTAQGCG
jgi:hypothetical protein